ncbi:hypothetical protein GALMADRAFT_120678 [Galerina marginata CBS 339.88]|uniref:Phosphatidic acid phosphatase type 2/haloperoxidase domain-containing protein n=1 Tax=Galerina marginata (strain CBS 339.88) TaxID=685588 RepID=A0A067T064_GALM3|nr:hypothetical protein GALMADRAFT_120678 [Galerina marginata CBS 339.88]
MESTKSVHFTLSGPPSEASSRSSSPAPSSPTLSGPPFYQNGFSSDYHDTKLKYNLLDDDDTPEQQRKDVYDSTLSWWRAGLRRKLVATVQWESRLIAKMQDKIRTPWLDAYFVYTSTLGTHTFFMTLLPALFFFGYDELGRGLLIILGLGIYVSSVVKDLFCAPRPFAPPVTRLTIGSHHLEYGFPSTHSTNSVSIALFFFAHIHRLANTPLPMPDTIISSLTNNTSSIPLTNSTTTIVDALTSTDSSLTEYIISPQLFTILNVILFIYAFSVVFGRLYTAMHSFTDCIMGILLGTGIWWGHSSWAGMPYLISPHNPLNYVLASLGFGAQHSSGSLLVHFGQGLGAGRWVDNWLVRGGWEIPLILIPLCLLAVHHHPQPVDDCPCFEDAIAILSVVLGALVSHWAMLYIQAGSAFTAPVIMAGSGWSFEMGEWVQVERGWNDILLWWTMATIKMAVGIIIIFTWRLLAKSTLHLILPPTFRLLARAFRLPHRRFYTPATEYKSVPSEFHSAGEGGGFGLHPIPSVIDLPSTGGVNIEVGGIGSGVKGVSNFHPSDGYGGRDLKMRAGNGNGNGHGNGNGNGGQNGLYSLGNANGNGVKNRNGNAGVASDKERTGKDGQATGVTHYDADVLTKVIVYAGIAVLATEALPLAFDMLGWGVKSSIAG